MGKMSISHIQLFCLIVLFELGSAIVIGVGMEAKQDAWLAIVIAMIFGLMIFLMHSYLYNLYPNEPFTLFVKKIVGKHAGNALTILYTCYFLYLGSRVLRDFTDFIEIYLLSGTPNITIDLLMVAVIAYGVFLGVEVIARTGEILFFISISLGFSFLFLVYISGKVHMENLQPVLEYGIRKVMEAAFPATTTFPFGEMIVFLMFLHYVNSSHKAKTIRICMLGIVISGLILSFAMITNIVVLGPYMVREAMLPLLETIGRVNIGGFIQRLDPLVIILLVVGGYFKISLFLTASVIGLASLEKGNKEKGYIIPLSLLMIALSIAMSSNTVEHLKIGLQIVPVYLHLPFQIGIPFVLCIIACIKNKYKKRQSSQGTNT